VDEVLVVAITSGAHLGVSILADLNPRRAVVPGQRDETWPLLTLGQVRPDGVFPRMPTGCAHRSYATFAMRRALPGRTLDAPGGRLCICAVRSVAVRAWPPEDKRLALVFSAAFTQIADPGALEALRWRFLRLLSKYLCCLDAPRGL